MDRLEFSNSIGIDPTVQVKEYFDEVMGMYNLIGEYENVSVIGSIQDQVLSFGLLFKTEKEATNMYDLVNDRTIPLYGADYIIHGSLNKKSLIINLS